MYTVNIYGNEGFEGGNTRYNKLKNYNIFFIILTYKGFTIKMKQGKLILK